jgi:hypothetical protein
MIYLGILSLLGLFSICIYTAIDVGKELEECDKELRRGKNKRN